VRRCFMLVEIQADAEDTADDRNNAIYVSIIDTPSSLDFFVAI
jgi:hypothetical protein